MLEFLGKYIDLILDKDLKTLKEADKRLDGLVDAFPAVENEDSIKDEIVKFLARPENSMPIVDFFEGLKACFESLFFKKGIFNGEPLLEFFQENVKSVLNNPKASFADLHNKVKEKSNTCKDLYVTALNTKTNQTCLMNYESSKYAERSIALAVRSSMAIPIFFTPVNFSDDDADYVDGGVLDNYPVWLFDRTKYTEGYGDADPLRPFINNQSLGFKLMDHEDRNTYEKRFYDNPNDFIDVDADGKKDIDDGSIFDHFK